MRTGSIDVPARVVVATQWLLGTSEVVETGDPAGIDLTYLAGIELE